MAANVTLPAGFQIDEQQHQQAGSTLPSGFVIDEPGQDAVNPEMSLAQKAADVVTGESRETEETRQLREVTGAPELGGLPEFSVEGLGELYEKGVSVPAFKTAAAMLFTGDPEKQMQAIKTNYPDAQFRTDEKGNVIVGLESGDYLLNAPGLSTSDVTRAVADIAAFTPAGRAATIPGAIAASGATEAALQAATQQSGGGDVDVGDVALSAALGGAGRAAEDAIGAGYRAIRGTPAPEAAETIAQAEARGIPVTTSDVSPPTTLPGRFAQQVGESVPIAGTGGMREAQQEARQSVAEKFVGKYIPDYDEIKQSITGKQRKIKQAAIDSRQRAVQQVQNVQTNASNTVKAIDDEIDRLTNLPGGQERQVVDRQAIETLQSYRDDIVAGGDFKTLDDLRTTFRDDLSPEFGKPGTRQEGAIKRIYGAMTRDMDDVIKDNLSPNEFRQWKRGNAVYGQEMEKLKKSRIKNVLQAGDELSPEQISRTIMSKDSVVRKRLYDSLDTAGRKNARSALISEVANKASPGGELSVNRLLNELDRNKGAIDTFFKGRERAELEGLKKVLNATRRAQEASVLTRTGMTTTPVIAGGAAVYDLGATLATGAGAGALSRAYESKMFRDALVKLNGTKKGSTQFEQALSDVAEYLTLAAQSGRRSMTTQTEQGQQQLPAQ